MLSTLLTLATLLSSAFSATSSGNAAPGWTLAKSTPPAAAGWCQTPPSWTINVEGAAASALTKPIRVHGRSALNSSVTRVPVGTAVPAKLAVWGAPARVSLASAISTSCATASVSKALSGVSGANAAVIWGSGHVNHRGPLLATAAQVVARRGGLAYVWSATCTSEPEDDSSIRPIHKALTAKGPPNHVYRKVENRMSPSLQEKLSRPSLSRFILRSCGNADRASVVRIDEA